ncbi:MAG: hypothetical protein LBI54_05520 [Lachnospiraceae bacterium]|jgi:hypothetical protein|nr:hypothetical protein [Lachnospiraceae bacterium]
MKLTNRKLAFCLIAVNIFHLALWTYIGTQKIDYHLDEYTTFVQANNYIRPHHDYNIGQVYPMGIVAAWNSVDGGHRFDFSIPYYSNAFGDDSHPPLYHMLVHFAYSLIPGHFSNWPALIINFIALTLTAYSVFFLARAVWADDGAALFVMAVFGTMWGVVNMAVFFRMYCLLMMWAGWLALWHLRAIREGGYNPPLRRQIKNYALLVALVFLGALTHYFFLVYLVFVALYYGIDLIVRKKWRAAGLYLGSLALAGGLYLLAFPYILSHFAITDDWAAAQLQLDGFGRAIASYIRLLVKNVCGDEPTLIISGLVVLAGGIWFFAKRRKVSREKVKMLAFITVPALLYLLAIARLALGYWVIDRYFAIILPAAAVVFWGLVYQAVKAGGQMVVAVALPLLFGWRRAAVLPDHCYQEMQGYHNMYAALLPEGNSVGVLHVYKKYTKLHVVLHYQALRNAKYLQVLPFEHLNLYSDFPEDGEIIVLVETGGADSLDGQNVAEEIRELGGKSQVRYLGYAIGCEVWLLE